MKTTFFFRRIHIPRFRVNREKEPLSRGAKFHSLLYFVRFRPPSRGSIWPSAADRYVARRPSPPPPPPVRHPSPRTPPRDARPASRKRLVVRETAPARAVRAEPHTVNRTRTMPAARATEQYFTLYLQCIMRTCTRTVLSAVDGESSKGRKNIVDCCGYRAGESPRVHACVFFFIRTLCVCVCVYVYDVFMYACMCARDDVRRYDGPDHPLSSPAIVPLFLYFFPSPDDWHFLGLGRTPTTEPGIVYIILLLLLFSYRRYSCARVSSSSCTYIYFCINIYTHTVTRCSYCCPARLHVAYDYIVLNVHARTGPRYSRVHGVYGQVLANRIRRGYRWRRFR